MDAAAADTVAAALRDAAASKPTVLEANTMPLPPPQPPLDRRASTVINPALHAFGLASTLHKGHGPQASPTWNALFIHVSDPVLNDARTVLHFFDTMPVGASTLFLVGLETMSGLHALRPGLAGLHAAIMPPPLPLDAPVLPSLPLAPVLQDRAVVITLDAQTPIDPSALMLGVPCARGCALVWHNAPTDARDRVPAPANRWTDVRHDHQEPNRAPLVATQFPAIGPLPAPLPSPPPSTHRRPGRAAKTRAADVRAAADKRLREPVDPARVRKYNVVRLRDCAGLVVEPDPDDPVKPLNLMDWTRHGPQTARWAPGPRHAQACPRDKRRADAYIAGTTQVPIMLWGDALSTNPGGVRSFAAPRGTPACITPRRPLTPQFERDLVVGGVLELHCFVGSVHYWTVQRVRYPGNGTAKFGIRCVAARHIPRGTVLAAYGGSLVLDSLLPAWLQPFCLETLRMVSSTFDSEEVPFGYVLAAQGNEVGTTMHLMDHASGRAATVGLVGANSDGECDARFVVLMALRPGDAITIDYGSFEGQGEKFIQHCDARRRKKKSRRRG